MMQDLAHVVLNRPSAPDPEQPDLILLHPLSCEIVKT